MEIKTKIIPARPAEEKLVWITDDGREHYSQADALNYEHTLRLETLVRRVESTRVQYSDYVFLYLSTYEEFEALKEWYSCYSYLGFNSENFKPQWILFRESNCDDNEYSIEPAKNAIQFMEHTLMQLKKSPLLL